MLGVYMGTHFRCRDESAYHGGNCFIDFLAFRWMYGDAYGNEEWRDRLLEFLAENEAFDDAVGAPPQMSMSNVPREPRRPVAPDMRGSTVTIMRKEDGFDKTKDSCVENTFNDYEARTCWICCRDNIQSYDKYACGHIFCSDCSDQMLMRGMPCPLCRRYTPTVMRTQN
jgi:hypothetical protein